MATLAYPPPTPSHTKNALCAAECDVDTCPSSIEALRFAFARINGNIYLVQVSQGSASSALSAVEVKIFVHEFITIWRYSHCDTLHPSDIRILESIDDGCALYEEENGTVFLAKHFMERLRDMTEKRQFGVRKRPPLVGGRW